MATEERQNGQGTAPSPVATAEPDMRPGGRTIAANSLWQLISFAARAISGSVSSYSWPAPVNRSLGVFQFAVTFASMLPFYWGLPVLLAHEGRRREPSEARTWAEGGTFIAIAAGTIFTLGFLVGVHVFGATRATALTLPLASVAMAFDGVARVQFAVFWAWEKMHLETIATCGQEFLPVGRDGNRVDGRRRDRSARGVHRIAGDGGVHRLADRKHQPPRPIVPRPHGGFARSATRRAAPFGGHRHPDPDLHASRLGHARVDQGAGRGWPLPGRNEPRALHERAGSVTRLRALSPDEQSLGQSP